MRADLDHPRDQPAAPRGRGRPAARRRRWPRAAAVAPALAALACLGLLSSCGDEATPDAETDAAIYAEVLRQVNGRQEVEEPPLLFVRPAAGHAIDLGVQAEVVRQLDKVASVRFVDEDDEVVMVDEPLEPVRDDAVVVTVSAIARTGPRAEVRAERYVDTRHVQAHCVALRRVGTEWRTAEGACIGPT